MQLKVDIRGAVLSNNYRGRLDSQSCDSFSSRSPICFSCNIKELVCAENLLLDHSDYVTVVFKWTKLERVCFLKFHSNATQTITWIFVYDVNLNSILQFIPRPRYSKNRYTRSPPHEQSSSDDPIRIGFVFVCQMQWLKFLQMYMCKDGCKDWVCSFMYISSLFDLLRVYIMKTFTCYSSLNVHSVKIPT